MHIGRLALSGILASLLLSGCSEDVNSEDIRTSGIWAGINVTSTSVDRAEVEVALKVGGGNSNTYINLTGGDTLTASINGGSPQKLGAYMPDALNPAYKIYTAYFYGSDAGLANSNFTIAFDRPNDTNAPNSIVTIPATLANFTHNAGTTSVSRAADAITFNWTPGSAGTKTLTLIIDGSCITRQTITGISDAAGTYTVNAPLLNKLGDTTSCVAIAELSINQLGTLDGAYGEGGYIKAHKIVTTSFTSIP